MDEGWRSKPVEEIGFKARMEAYRRMWVRG
jgi:hypothetical protein